MKRYNADPAILGRVIRLDAEPFTVVGVAPPRIEEIFNDLEFFRPYPVRPEENNPQARYGGNIRLVGRLKPGVTYAAGRAQLRGLEKSFADNQAVPQLRAFLAKGGYRVAVNDAREEMAEPIKARLLLLQGGAALVLLIGSTSRACCWPG